ncbi:MAG: hypothetical protein H6581_09760 [Bacteroidia bacterium]|nr:hypothetical protein [Bacteroidia bacterium]
MALLKLITRLKQFTLPQLFTIYLRYLIGLAFIIAAIGMGKLGGKVDLLGAHSAPIQDLEPIQQFFRVMMDSGFYWKFIGWTQILAGVLLATQRFARVGALIFFGIILNIFIITLSYGFHGTPVVTGLMLLATTWLLVWDLPALLILFTDKIPAQSPAPGIISRPFWAWQGLALVGVVVISLLLQLNMFFVFGLPLGLGILGLGGFFWGRRK